MRICLFRKLYFSFQICQLSKKYYAKNRKFKTNIETIEHSDGSGDEYWDQTTSSRQVVASGLYIAHITDNDSGETAERKFVIIR